jgi:5,10-methylenetetrahydromethanopterin reductase
LGKWFSLGAGDKTTLKMLNVVQEKPLSAIREAVTIIRSLTSGESTDGQGDMFNVSGVNFSFRAPSPVKIFIGAQGQKMLILAGEIGDGVLINASHPRDIESAVKHAWEGAEKARRSFEELAVPAYTSFSIPQDHEKALKTVTPIVPYIAAGYPDSILNAHGVSTDVATELATKIIK